jgi:GNAT superfamily N-acetyltransferase
VTSRIEILGEHHDVTRLNSGEPELDDWLKRAARINSSRDLCRVYVVTDDDDVVAYSALVASTIGPESLTSRAGNGLPQVIPAVLLGKLAVDADYQSAGLGRALLGHAGKVAVAIREQIGARFLYADALNDSARQWYINRGMRAVAGSRVCFARIKDLAG